MVQWSAASLGQQDRTTQRYWARYMGAAETWDEVSPALRADRIAAPVLLIHGSDDTVVPFAQSAEMEGALRRAGKSVELVTLKSEDHWLSRGSTRLEMLRATVDFLAKNNPP
jgi:dipeptidyl aminopeptidase/acylaminoacyl peptidase